MRSVDDLIKNFSSPYQVNTDFEAGVYSKIEQRRKMTRIRVSGAIGFVLVLVLFSVFVFIPGNGSDESPGNRVAARTGMESTRVLAKEEIPVLEDVFFTLTDGEKNYAIEQVSISEEEGI